MRIVLTALLFVALMSAYMLLRSTSTPQVSTAPGVPPVAETPAAPVPVAQPAPTAGTPPPEVQPPKPAHSTAPAPPAVTTYTLFKDKVTPRVFELAPGALAVWRDFSAHKPALVLFSTHPLLDPLPATERKNTKRFVLGAPATEVVRRGRLNVADPAILPPQTVSAAIESGLIGELIFVQPTTRKIDQFSLANFQQRAFEAGFLSEQEARALQMKDGAIRGRVRGIPFRCVHPDALPALRRPVIVHIDLGYFKDLFVNDVKTPLYNLLHQTVLSIRDSRWQSLAATLSYSNQEVNFSLETRFLISNLASLIQHPELLTNGTPPSWKARADSRFARAMFAETTADELTTQAVDLAPDDPDALYALSMQKFAQQDPDEGFALLDRAVAQDPGYALAYIELADTAVEKGRQDKAEELLNKAAQTFTVNPFLRIALADLLIQRKRGNEAIPLLHELQGLPWSTRYYPGIPEQLERMLTAAAALPAE